MIFRIRSLAVTSAGSCAVDVDRQRLRLALQQALRREHVADLRRADAEGEGAERAVRARVRVAADDRRARLRRAELGPHDVHDAAVAAREAAQLDAEILAVALHLPHLLRGRRLADDLEILQRLDGHGRRRVIERREAAIGAAHGQALRAQQVERLRRRDLVQQVQVDVEDGRRVVRLGHDDVRGPNLLEQRLHERSLDGDGARAAGLLVDDRLEPVPAIGRACRRTSRRTASAAAP